MILGGIIDRYLFRGALVRLFMIVGVILAILGLENVGRLAAEMQKTSQPMTLIGRLMVALIPEHLSVAIPVALMLAVALTVRQMSLSGEWQMLSAAGISRTRKMAGLMGVALIAAVLQSAVRFDWRPAGEHTMDSIYLGLRTGAFGVPLPVRESINLDKATTLYISGVGPGGLLKGVMIRREDKVFTAPLADVDKTSDGGLLLSLHNGVAVTRGGERLAFDVVKISGAPGMIDPEINDFRHQLDRQSAFALVQLIRHGSPKLSHVALTALTMRVDNVLFCLLIPLFGIVLGVPGRRHHTAGGIGVAVVLIVLQIKSTAFVEDNFWDHALIAEAVHIGIWLALAALVIKAEDRLGEGFIEEAVARSRSTIIRLAKVVRRPTPAQPVVVPTLRQVPVLRPTEIVEETTPLRRAA